ncbi:MAG: hypothetical protein PHC34_10975 [Candidatus Gastranaerophilales bacterium]|nr:hypothetical protein [Candidatus Gastranaerophilales bacterium]
MIIGSINSEIIKILFDTNKESLFLGDFIKVINKDDTGILAQVTKIDSSKDKPSCNIAGCKILFTLISDDKLISWRGNVPSKDNAVSIVSNTELLSYMDLNNLNDISIGQLTLYQNTRFKFDINSLKNPTLIFCDKQEQRTNLSHLLSQEIAKSGEKVVLLDLKGEYSYINYAKKLIAGRDFKLPLNSKGIDVLYEKTLFNVSAQTRAVIEDIFMSVQEYADESDKGFIPFSSFKQVVEDEYEQSNIPELILLKNKLTKLDKEGIFANTEYEINSLDSYITNNNFIILNLSYISSLWHKEFINSIISSNIENYNQSFSLVFEMIDKNIDDELINKLYVHGIKSGIKPIVSIEYESKYAGNISAAAKNLIFFSPQIQTEKFPAFNNFINRLSSSETLVTGQITKNIPLFVQIDQVVSNNEIEEDFKLINNAANQLQYLEDENATNTLIENQPVYFDTEDEFYEHYEEQEETKIQPEYNLSEELTQIQYDAVDALYTTKIPAQEFSPQDAYEELENIVRPTPDIPIYSTAEETEEKEFDLEEGDTVRHQKYGEGVIKKIIGYGNKKLCSIEFNNVGRRLLDPNLAVIEKV